MRIETICLATYGLSHRNLTKFSSFTVKKKQALSLSAAIQNEHPRMTVVVPTKDTAYEI